MARVHGGVPVSGTIGPVTYYQMYGRSFVRAKSSLTRKRVLKSKEFAETRKFAGNFGIAAGIGSVIYKALPDDIRKDRWLYRAIAGEAASLLYEEKTEEEVQEILWKKYITDPGAQSEGEAPVKESGQKPTKESRIKLRQAFMDRWQRQGLSYYWFKRAWPKRRFNFYPPTFREGLNEAIRQRKEFSG